MTIVVGTAGHIDHGKTRLLHALTGIDADRLPEERRRGMTIDVGYAWLALEDGAEIDFVDVPGHDRLVGNMLVGAGEIDAAMLVVAADDGPRAQTIEHLELLDALDIRDGLAVVTKADLVDAARLADVVAEVEELLGQTSLAGAPVLAASAHDGLGIDALRAALAELVHRLGTGRTSGDAAAHLSIDRAFTVRGRGLVVTGTLRGGSIARGDSLELSPGGRTVRIREVQVHGAAVERAGPGRAAFALAGVDSGDVTRGMILARGESIAVTDRLLVALRTPRVGRGEARLPSDRARLRLHAGTAQVGAIVSRGGREAAVLPGGEMAALVRLEAPMAVAPGQRFVLRRPSPGRTEAGGRILDPEPPRGAARRRISAARLTALAGASSGDERLAALLALHGARDTQLASDLGDALEARAVGLVANEADGVSLGALRGDLAATLRRGASIERPDAETAVEVVIDELVARGRLVRDGARIRDPQHRPSVASTEMLAAMDRLERALAVPAPPPLAEAAQAAGCSGDGVRALESAGRIVVVAGDIAWSASAYRELEARALALAASAPLAPAALRDATGTSRKYVMALLEDLDRRGVLRRTPAGHVPGPRAAVPSP